MFGDDATIAQVSHVANTSIVAFGNALSATLTYADELRDPQTIAKLVRDNIALSQRGCMSSRINLVVGELGLQSREDLITALRLALRDKASIDTARYVARSLEVVRLQQAGGRVERFGTVDGLVCFFENPLNVQTMISKQELNFIFHIASEQTIAISEPWGAALGEIKKLSASNGAQRLLDITPALTRQIQVVPLGTLNAAPFDGLHLGLPIFS
jgi:hypothetical protein